MSRTALVLIATGHKYWPYINSFLESAKKFFVPHDTFLFTDNSAICNVKYRYPCEALGYPKATLYRYHTILRAQSELSRYDYIFYSDIDMRFIASVLENEIFSNGITATEHPGFVGLVGSPERNPESTAYVECPRTYFCGGFNGGTSRAYLRMAEAIRASIDADLKKGFVAVWHDESHLNRYLYDNPPARILTPSFCYPDTPNDFYRNLWREKRGVVYEPKLLALVKNPQ